MNKDTKGGLFRFCTPEIGFQHAANVNLMIIFSALKFRRQSRYLAASEITPADESSKYHRPASRSQYGDKTRRSQLYYAD